MNTLNIIEFEELPFLKSLLVFLEPGFQPERARGFWSLQDITNNE